MNMLKVFVSIGWFMSLLMILSICATGAFTYLWVIQGLVKKQAGKWNDNNPFAVKFAVNPPLLQHPFEKSGRLKRWMEALAHTSKNILIWHEQRLIKSGMVSKSGRMRAKQWCASILGVSLYLLIRDIGHPENALLFCFVLSVYFWMMTGSKIKERKNTFVTGVYKIYRHMALQISSGMSSAESIKYLHESVEEPFLKEAIYRFSSSYFKTMNLELSLKELTERIEGDEVQVLAMVLRQGLQTGDSYEMIIKQEQLMVKRYYAALSAESERIRRKGVLIAIGLCVLIFLLLAAPMVYEMGRATQSIFLGQ